MYLRLNIGGCRQIFLLETLATHPNTRLANFAESDHETRRNNCDGFFAGAEEYFFDRSPFIFDIIAQIYRSGKLHLPANICQEMVLEELSFWQIDPDKYFLGVFPTLHSNSVDHGVMETISEHDEGDSNDIEKGQVEQSTPKRKQIHPCEDCKQFYLNPPVRTTDSRPQAGPAVCQRTVSEPSPAPNRRANRRCSISLMGPISYRLNDVSSKYPNGNSVGYSESFDEDREHEITVGDPKTAQGVPEVVIGVDGRRSLCKSGGKYERLKKNVFQILHSPQSNLGKVVMGISIFFIILSMIILCLESIPSTHGFLCYKLVNKSNHPASLNMVTITKNESNSTPDMLYLNETSSDVAHVQSCRLAGFTVMDLLDLCCVLWFTFEYLACLWSNPDRLKFVFSWTGLIDVLSFLPFYIECIMISANSGHYNSYQRFHRMLLALRILRIVRVTRLLKVARYSRGLQVIGVTMRRSFSELGMVAIYVLLLTIFFATLVYFVESEEKGTQFTNIPLSAWWSIVTLTTLGYGDMVPMTIAGKLVATMATISGVLLLAFPISVLVERFTSTYAEMSQPDGEDKASYTKQKKMLHKVGKNFLKIRRKSVRLDSTRVFPEKMVSRTAI